MLFWCGTHALMANIRSHTAKRKRSRAMYERVWKAWLRSKCSHCYLQQCPSRLPFDGPLVDHLRLHKKQTNFGHSCFKLSDYCLDQNTQALIARMPSFPNASILEDKCNVANLFPALMNVVRRCVQLIVTFFSLMDYKRDKGKKDRDRGHAATRTSAICSEEKTPQTCKPYPLVSATYCTQERTVFHGIHEYDLPCTIIKKICSDLQVLCRFFFLQHSECNVSVAFVWLTNKKTRHHTSTVKPETTTPNCIEWLQEYVQYMMHRK